MMNFLFLLILTLLCGAVLWWGFAALPRERWQMLAALPVRKADDGRWLGINLTWYGLLTANAYLAATAMVLVLLGAVGVPTLAVGVLAALLLGLCVPASQVVARLVERKAHTFTVGGAVFVGIVAAPWAVWLLNRLAGPWWPPLPVLPTLAALAIAYTFGEGLGRLACISFGCCYGKPLERCSPWLHRLFRHWHFTFPGATRKIAYASGLEGAKVVPVQALTAGAHVATGLVGTWLFLASRPALAFVLVILVTQIWRVLSELLRADHRGGRRISPYQIMGLLAIPYTLTLAFIFAGGALPTPDIGRGLWALWNPLTLLLLQGLWLAVVAHTGRSQVTGSVVAFHVHADRI